MNASRNPNTEQKGKVNCPLCDEPVAVQYHPFCSKRCADVDLHRWLSGTYAIPAEEDDGYEEDEG